MENKVDTVICLGIGKTCKAKTPLGDFKVTTLENPLLSQQAVTNKGIPIPYTNLQLNPYLNTQLDLFCSDNFPFQCTAPSTWLTNRCTDPSTWLTTNLRRMLAVKFFSSSTRWRSRSSLLQNLTAYKRSSFFKRKMLRHMSPVTICLWNFFALSCIHLH